MSLLKQASNALNVLGKGFLDENERKRKSIEIQDQMRSKLKQQLFGIHTKVIQNPDQYTPEQVAESTKIIQDQTSALGINGANIPQQRPLTDEEKNQQAINQMLEKLSGRSKERFAEQVGILSPIEKEVNPMDALKLTEQKVKNALANERLKKLRSGGDNPTSTNLVKQIKEIDDTIFNLSQSDGNESEIASLEFLKNTLAQQMDKQTGKNIPIGIRAPELIFGDGRPSITERISDPVGAALQDLPKNNANATKLQNAIEYANNLIAEGRKKNINDAQIVKRVNDDLKQKFGLTLEDIKNARSN